MALAPAVIAQQATNLGANNLPLRNVLIEVRQVQTRQDDRLQLSALAAQGQGQQSDNTIQQVLVLNGRSARIALGTRTPMRVLQTVLRNGVLVAVASALVWDAGTGFVATPRWNGSDTLELEMAAFQNIGADATTQQTRSVVAVPLAQWMTVAQSDTQSDGQRTGLDGMAQHSAHSSSSVQVRLTLP